MVTQHDIAKRCKVSVAAVSAAFRRPKQLAPETRDKILQTARDLGYLHQSPQLKSIGLLVGNFKDQSQNEYFGEIILGILQRSTDLNMTVKILERLPDKYYDVCEVAGFIFLGKPSAAVLEQAETLHLKYILAGCPSAQRRVPSLSFDHSTGFGNLLEYVASCQHRKLTLINGANDPHDEVWQEFTKVAREFCDKSRIDIKYAQTSYHDGDLTETVVLRALSENPKPSCLLCSNDKLAYVVYSILLKHGLSIPQDISVTGFDGINPHGIFKLPSPTLTSVHTNRFLLGQKALDLLLDHLKNPKVSKPHLMESRLRVGASVRVFKAIHRR